MASTRWFVAYRELPRRRKALVSLLSFLLPFTLWAAISYVPWIWHPMIKVTEPGGIPYFTPGLLIEKSVFENENLSAAQDRRPQAQGVPANPVFLPAPHEVAQSFVDSFVTPPRREGEPWFHESLGHSIRIIVLGFLLSSLFGVPLGILCGTYGVFRGLFEPFIEFFRYLPAPAFGALAVAVFGINDEAKIAIIFVGTFFQQVLIISNTTQKLEPTLLEAAQTLGAKRGKLLTRVVIPAVLPELYRDLRILLGWAWTYLIVSEVVGTSTGITWFINTQAKYRIYDNVFAAIAMIGIIGILTDALLARLGKRLFPWHRDAMRQA